MLFASINYRTVYGAYSSCDAVLLILLRFLAFTYGFVFAVEL